MIWTLSHRCDKDIRPLADRHYNRRSVGAANFVPPGRCLVLKTCDLSAFWITSWPLPEFVRHAWPGAWMCSAFRLERPDLHLASSLIRQAIAVTIWKYGPPPPLGMVTFVDPDKTRRKRDPGRCFLRAGFNVCGETKGGLVALQIYGPEMPEPCAPMPGPLWA